MKLSEIKINPRNPQKFTDLAKLEASVKDFPKMFKYRPIVVDKDNMVLGGNKRLICLQNLGFKEIPDEWVKKATDLNEDEIKRFIVSDNVGHGTWDWEILEADFNLEDLSDWGLEMPEFESEPLETLGDDEIPAEPKNIFVVRGDIFEIKANDVTLRIGCLDSCNSDDIEKLTQKTVCELLFTSPPYSDMRTYDNKGNETNVEFLIEFIPTFLPYAKYQVINLGLQRKNHEIVEYWQSYIEKAKQCGYKFLSWNVWNRMKAGTIAHQTAMFTMVHEWIFVFGKEYKEINRTVENNILEYEKRHGKDWKNGKVTKIRQKDGSFSENMTNTYTHHQLHTVNDIYPQLNRDEFTTQHPAAFPVELPENYILAMTNEKDFVAEPFCGSGTTALACLKTKRNCFTNDISENYVQVAVKRIIDFCNKNSIKFDITLNNELFDVNKLD